jgi:hypothetical protein
VSPVLIAPELGVAAEPAEDPGHGYLVGQAGTFY